MGKYIWAIFPLFYIIRSLEKSFMLFRCMLHAGTLEERGIIGWRGGNKTDSIEEDAQEAELMTKCYNLPFSTNWR